MGNLPQSSLIIIKIKRRFPMKVVENIAKWLCRTLTKQQVVLIIDFLKQIVSDPESVFKKADPELPNYRSFKVDPEPPIVYKVEKSEIYFKHIIKEKNIKPISHRCKNRSEKHIRCPHCHATHDYIYINNGKTQKSIQYSCKVCKKTFCKTPKKTMTKYLCPICGKALYKWKSRLLVTIYKCGNDLCPRYLDNKNSLSQKEKETQKIKSSQFKLRYCFREYSLNLKQIIKEELEVPVRELSKFRYSLSTIGLVLAFHITLKQSTRMTAFALKGLFGISISHNTISRIASAASYVCHHFNMENIPKVPGKQVGDETYIKVKGIHHYVWLIASEYRSIITAYMVSDNRGEIPAVKTMYMATQKQIDNSEDNPLVFISDGNPSYQAAATYLNSQDIPVQNIQVIGLENKDETSATFRYLKNIIERINRTYGHCAKNNFQFIKGASSHLALAVTNYNFIRPHSTLNYETPVVHEKLKKIDLIQNKWAEILKSAA